MFERLLGPDQFDILPHLVAIGIAYFLAVHIGWNREKTDKARAAGPFRWWPWPAAASSRLAVMLSLVTIATLWIMDPVKQIGHLDDRHTGADDEPSEHEDGGEGIGGPVRIELGVKRFAHNAG